MKIVVKPLSELVTPEYNVRRHTDKQVKELVRSVEKYGQIRPIVIDEDGVILCGNGLKEALLSLGRETGECLIQSGLSDAEKKKLMLADNRIYDLGVNDIAAFDAIIAELDGDFDIPGYDDEFLESLIADAEETTAVLSEYGTLDEDEAEAIRTAENTPVRPVQSVQSEPSAESPVATREEAPESGETPGGRFVHLPELRRADMAVKRVQGDITVVEAAKRRIRNVFGNDLHVYMSFSGGKDSLCLGQIVYTLIQAGEIDPSLLTVIFIDEEAIFPCIEETVKAWRKKFMLAGAEFRWYCLEVRHFSCFNQLEADESFICWDHTKSDVWVRQPPPFAIRTDPCLKPRVDNYQAFLPRVTRDGIMLSGVRTAESIQRLQYMAALGLGGKGLTGTRQIYPIYDWKTADVWKFLLDEHVEIPDIYLFMWQAGIGKGQLRVSQFFSSDTAGCLVRMNEYYPDLMERVIRREPNAYLAALYWDSEMFGRSTRTRKELEAGEPPDYKEKLVDMLIRHPERHFHTEHQKHVAEQYRKAFIKIEGMARPRDYRKLYDGIVAGDPKLRTLRAVHQDVACAYAEYSKQFRKGAAANG